MVSWKYPVLKEVALGADAAEGVWAQAQQRSGLRAVLLASRSVAKSQFFHRIADRLGSGWPTLRRGVHFHAQARTAQHRPVDRRHYDCTHLLHRAARRHAMKPGRRREG